MSEEKKFCLECGKEIIRSENQDSYDFKRKKFCNNSCAASYNNKNKKKKEHFCEHCGKKLKRKQKFCNNKCQADFEYQEYIKGWKADKEDGMSGKFGISSHIRRYLYEKYDNKCSKCGWNEVNTYTNNIPLEIEHKDGNYRNNKEENLELLCPNCHSLTATYKGANKGNGRKDRAKYWTQEDTIAV